MADYEQPSTSAFPSTGLFSPPATTASHQRTASSSVPAQSQPLVTSKSHRLRTSPLANEGNTFVPVVKFSQSFSQRNALSSIKPVYGPQPSSHASGKQPATAANVTQDPQGGGEILAVPRIGGPGRGDTATHGWTISITSSSPTEDEIQVQVQQHLQRHFDAQPYSHIYPTQQQPQRAPQQTGRLLGGATAGLHSPAFPLTQIPILAHDRSILSEEDLRSVKVKSILFLVCGVVFPPVWVMMGWGHMLEAVILPRQWMMTTNTQQVQIMEVYRPYRLVAGVLGGVVVVGCLVGIVLGGLALGGILG